MLDYRHLLWQAPARLLVLAPEPHRFSILDASDAYLEATLTTRDIVGRPMFDVFPDNPAEPAATGVSNLTASFERALAARGTDVMAVQKYDVRDRSGHFVERHWTPVNGTLVGGDGSLTGLVHRVEDVTAFVRQGEVLEGEAAQLRHEVLARASELAQANVALRDSLELRRKILAIVSHDLRTPLSAVRTGVDVLRRQFINFGGTPPRIFDTLQASTIRMEELLGDLDDYAASHITGMMPVEREHVNLRAVCQDVVAAEQVAHPDRDIELEPGDNVDAFVDPRRQHQLLTNLINNALAYGAKDRPVRVSLRRTTGHHVITVSNEGDPVPEDVIPTLFEPFQRGPASRGRRAGHMGLGLFIVRQIADAHGGGVEVKSSPRGTHFAVYIPVQSS